jgi:Nitrile hydratase, alpha chain
MSSVSTHIDETTATSQVKRGIGSAAAEEGLKRWSRVVKEAWANDAFKQRLLTDPAAVLDGYGLKAPPGLDIRVVENTDGVVYLTLPPTAAASRELTLDQLDQIVGGTAVEYAVMLALIIVVCIDR